MKYTAGCSAHVGLVVCVVVVLQLVLARAVGRDWDWHCAYGVEFAAVAVTLCLWVVTCKMDIVYLPMY